MNRGFTLLEVLIALAILSTVALLAVRVSGDSLTQLAETDGRTAYSAPEEAR